MKTDLIKLSTPYIGPGHIFTKQVEKSQPKNDNQRPEIYY